MSSRMAEVVNPARALSLGEDDPRKKCRRYDPEVFFPERTDPEYGEKVFFAKAICDTCPFVARCREDAIVNNERDGVWGATDPDERSLIRRRRNREAKKAAKLAEQQAAQETGPEPELDGQLELLNIA